MRDEGKVRLVLPAPEPTDVLLVLMTAPDEAMAAYIGRTLVEERLAACVNILPSLRSIYLWKETIHDEAEVLCLVKTRTALYDEVRARIEALHPYEVPEILGVHPDRGNAAYLAWIMASTNPSARP